MPRISQNESRLRRVGLAIGFVKFPHHSIRYASRQTVLFDNRACKVRARPSCPHTGRGGLLWFLLVGILPGRILGGVCRGMPLFILLFYGWILARLVLGRKKPLALVGVFKMLGLENNNSQNFHLELENM